jgi:hypothetical protein
MCEQAKKAPDHVLELRGLPIILTYDDKPVSYSKISDILQVLQLKGWIVRIDRWSGKYVYFKDLENLGYLTEQLEIERQKEQEMLG